EGVEATRTLLDRQLGEHHLGADCQREGNRHRTATPAATGAGWCDCTDSMQARATARARRASTPVTEGARCSRTAETNSTNSPAYASTSSSTSPRAVSCDRPSAV